MKRLLIALTLFVGTIGATPAAHAATTNAPARQVQSGVIHSADQLKIPLSATYPPPGFQIDRNLAMSPADADTNTLQGQYLHATMPYRNLGVLGMWYQEFSVQYADNATAFLTYLGSYYASPDAAAAALNDVVASGQNPQGQPFRIQTCQVAGASQCLDVRIGALGTFTDHWRIIQVSNALMESGYLIPSDDYQTNQATLEQMLNDMTTAFINTVNGVNNNPPPTPVTPNPTPVTPKPTPVTPKPTPVTPKPTPVPTTNPTSQVSWEILGVHVEKAGAQANYRSKSLKKVKTGKKMQLTVYLGIHFAPAGTPVKVAIGVFKGKKLVWTKSAGGDLQADETQRAIPVSFDYKFKGTGTQTIVGKAQLGTTPVQQAQVKVKVTK